MHYFTVHDISNFADDFCLTVDHFLSHCYQVLRSCYFAFCLFSCGVDYLLCFAYFQDDFNDALQYDFWISKGLGDKLACVASVSSRSSSRKLGQEQKKNEWRWRGRGMKEWKRLLRRLVTNCTLNIIFTWNIGFRLNSKHHKQAESVVYF